MKNTFRSRLLLLLFLLFSASTYADTIVENPSQNLTPEQGALSVLAGMEEKIALTPGQKQALKEAWIAQVVARESLVSEAGGSDVPFNDLLELHRQYQAVEDSILSPAQQEALRATPQANGIQPLHNSITVPGSPCTQYLDSVKTPKTIHIPQGNFYSDQCNSNFTASFYVDFGNDYATTLSWEVDLNYCTINIYTLSSTLVKRISTIVGKGNADLPQGVLFVEITGSGVLDGITSRKGVSLTFTPKSTVFDNLSVTGDTYISGSAMASEAVGVISDFGSASLSVPDGSYAGFFTDRPYFQFNKPVRVTGSISSIGATNLYLQTNGTTHATIQSSTGNMGIGTTTPTQKLEVNGNIKTNGLIMNGDIQVGGILTPPEGSYGKKLYFGDPAEGTDPVWISRFNPGYDRAELRVNLGDDQVDKLMIGAELYYSNPGEFTPVLTATMDGQRVGIGNSNPAQTLDVWGTGKMDRLLLDPNNGGTMNIHVDNSAYAAFATNRPYFYLDKPIQVFNGIMGSMGASDLQLQTNGTTHATILNSNGNVGIGIANPLYKLDVNGIVRAEEVIINTDGADFVFADDYRLRSLREVEEHITANKHLPDIPSAASMQENGVGMAELQIKLLQKIEELTLYVIEQQKKIESLEKQLQTSK